MAGKDPAFLFYSKDWLEGTAEMTPEEKGVYIDLLAHQHQKGSLPSEIKRLAKLSALSESEFLEIWKDLSTKFIPNGSGRLVNRKLNGIVTTRKDKGYRNKIIGTLAAVVRYSDQTDEIKAKIKKNFKVDDFLGCESQKLTERVTEWYAKQVAEWEAKRLKSIGNANAINNSIISNNESINNNELELNISKSEKKTFNTKPSYEDFNGLPEITNGSAIQLIKITKYVDVSKDDVDGLWNIFKHQSLTGKKFYQNESDVYSHFINWIKKQDFKDGKLPYNACAKSKLSKEDALKQLIGGVGSGSNR